MKRKATDAPYAARSLLPTQQSHGGSPVLQISPALTLTLVERRQLWDELDEQDDWRASTSDAAEAAWKTYLDSGVLQLDDVLQAELLEGFSTGGCALNCVHLMRLFQRTQLLEYATDLTVVAAVVRECLDVTNFDILQPYCPGNPLVQDSRERWKPTLAARSLLAESIEATCHLRHFRLKECWQVNDPDAPTDAKEERAASARRLAASLGKHPGLVSITLHLIRGDAGLLSGLLEALPELEHLQLLEVSCEEGTASEMAALADLLPSLPALSKLTLISITPQKLQDVLSGIARTGCSLCIRELGLVLPKYRDNILAGMRQPMANILIQHLGAVPLLARLNLEEELLDELVDRKELPGVLERHGRLAELGIPAHEGDPEFMVRPKARMEDCPLNDVDRALLKNAMLGVIHPSPGELICLKASVDAVFQQAHCRLPGDIRNVLFGYLSHPTAEASLGLCVASSHGFRLRASCRIDQLRTCLKEANTILDGLIQPAGSKPWPESEACRLQQLADRLVFAMKIDADYEADRFLEAGIAALTQRHPRMSAMVLSAAAPAETLRGRQPWSRLAGTDSK